MSVSRRGLIGIGLAGLAGAAVTGCTYGVLRDSGPSGRPPVVPAPLTVSMDGETRLHMIQTGWVAVKKAHRAFDGSPALRLPAIMFGDEWTNWMPVTCFVVEHAGEIIVVDTGESVRILEERDYTSCDAVTGFFYRRNLRFALSQDDEIESQMARVGIDPQRVSRIVLTHLHSDHVGGLSAFAGKPALVSRQAAGGHAGALLCRVQENVELQPVDLIESNVGAFARSTPLTQDGKLSLVATPGHAAGHLSVLMRSGPRSVLLAGDAAFSRDQIKAQEMAGIVESWEDARDTLKRLKAQAEEFGTLILPAHDEENWQALIDFTG